MQIPVRGCRDVFPAAALARRETLARFAEIARCYGFSEVETPLLERSDLYVSALGESSDIVTSELFHVTGPPSNLLQRGRDERTPLVLRPEGTAGIARAFGSRVKNGSAPARVWYAGPMFRYERPQRLRLRQFSQIGVECLNEPSVHADLDSILLANEFVRSTPGGKGSSLVINSLGTKADREEYNKALHGWLTPRLQSLSPLSRHRHATGNCMRILDSKLSEDQDCLVGAPLLPDFVGKEEHERFTGLQRLLQAEKIPFIVDPKLVRGLDYYSSTAFEFLDSDGRAVCAGGRYEDVQGVDGVGFAAGLERLEATNADNLDESPETSEVKPLENGIAVLCLTSSPDLSEDALGRRLMRQLRELGVRAVLRPVKTKVGKAVGRAVKEGADAVVVIGPDDVKAKVVQLKLVDGSSHDVRHEQRALSIKEAVGAILVHRNARDAAGSADATSSAV